MADLAKFQQETTAAYQPAYTSLQNQLGQLDKKLASTKEDIANQYARQQAGLNRQRNQAAEQASMQAAGSGGSFGGAANIANRKYYEQTFTPALQNINANEAAAYKAAQEARDNSYDSLSNQLAQLQAEANKYALQRYDAAVEAERQAAEAERNRRAQLAAARASSNALSYLDQNSSKGWSSPYVYKNGAWYNNTNGKTVKAGAVADEISRNTGMSYNDALRQVLDPMRANNSYVAPIYQSLIGGNAFNYGKSSNYTGNSAFDRLGIKMF